MNYGLLPSAPGAYLLHLHLPRPRCLPVGRLGVFDFLPGEYLYAGSACGPGGLRARLGRHLIGTGTPRWHIDFLRRAAEVGGYGYALDGENQGASLECCLAQALARLPEAIIPIPGFGSSDCRLRCRAHLVVLPFGTEIPFLKILRQVGARQVAPALS